MPSSDRRRALVLVCLFAVATATNYTNHGPLLGLIGQEFGLSAAAAGGVATAFFVGSAATMLLGGLGADRFGPRRVVTLGFALVAASNLASGLLSPTFASLLAWRAVGGLGSGAAFAAGASYTRGVFEGRGSHLAQGLYGAGFLLGSGSTLLLMPALVGPADDWRRAFALSGLAVTACWLAWLAAAPAGPVGGGGAAAGLGAAVRARNTWLLAACHMSGFGLAIVVSTWATAYLTHTFGLPLGAAGALGSLLLVTGIAGRSAGGVVLERGVRPPRLIRGSLALAALGLLLLALPGAAPLPVGAGLGVAVLGLLVTGVGVGLPYAAVFNGAAASAPGGPGSAQAFVGWGAIWVTVVGPPLVGRLLDATGSFAAGFAALAGFAVLTLAGTRWLRPFAPP